MRYLHIIFLAILPMMFFAFSTTQAQSMRKINDISEGLDHRFPYEEIASMGHIEMHESLKTAILNNLKYCKQRLTNEVVLLRSCRTAHGGCEARIDQFVEYIIEAGIQYDLNPWMLAAVAYNESRFNPFAVGYAVGSMGIFQINPRSKRGKKSKFVRNKRYRDRCQKEIGNCQKSIVFMGAEHLRAAIDQCEGFYEGLSIYNTGRCDIRKKYVYNTLKAWRNLLDNSYGEKEDLPWCTSKKLKKK